MAARKWDDVDAKRRAVQRCAACGRWGPLEAAHLIGRARDRKVGRQRVVDPCEVTMLCGPFPSGCHGLYDQHQLDLYPFLSSDELAGAVRAAGSPGMALRRLSGPLWRLGTSEAVRTLDERLVTLEKLSHDLSLS